MTGSLTQNRRNNVNLVSKKNVSICLGHGVIHRDAIGFLLKLVFG